MAERVVGIEANSLPQVFTEIPCPAVSWGMTPVFAVFTPRMNPAMTLHRRVGDAKQAFTARANRLSFGELVYRSGMILEVVSVWTPGAVTVDRWVTRWDIREGTRWQDLPWRRGKNVRRHNGHEIERNVAVSDRGMYQEYAVWYARAVQAVLNSVAKP